MPDVTMSYTNYEEDIVQAYHVELQNWPFGEIKPLSAVSNSQPPLRKLRDALVSGACKWVHLTEAEVQEREKRFDDEIEAGLRPPRKERKKRRDAGLSRGPNITTIKRKANETASPVSTAKKRNTASSSTLATPVSNTPAVDSTQLPVDIEVRSHGPMPMGEAQQLGPEPCSGFEIPVAAAPFPPALAVGASPTPPGVGLLVSQGSSPYSMMASSSGMQSTVHGYAQYNAGMGSNNAGMPLAENPMPTHYLPSSSLLPSSMHQFSNALPPASGGLHSVAASVLTGWPTQSPMGEYASWLRQRIATDAAAAAATLEAASEG